MRNWRFAIGLVLTSWFVVLIPEYVGLQYEHVIENEPLHAPQPIEKISGNQLTLTNGRVFKIEDFSNYEWPVSDKPTDFQVDLVRDCIVGQYILFGNRKGRTPGSLQKLFIVPLFKKTVYKNRRQPIFLAYEITDEELVSDQGGIDFKNH